MAAADRDLQAAIAVTRFGLGAKPGEIQSVRADPRGWLKHQIRANGADQPQGPEGPLPTMQASFAVYAAFQAQVRPARLAARSRSAGGESNAMVVSRLAEQAKDAQEIRRVAAQPLRQQTALEMLSRTQLATTTPAGFRERWTLFWANHFSVAVKSLMTSVAVGPFEREAVRPHVFGSFADMLAASSQHPAMLLYLDQVQSAGPNSPVARRRNIGLNENLAREILELHTVGPEGGYEQADVTEFARALTGWSMGDVNAGAQAGAYSYRAGLHEPGSRRVMGRIYREGQQEQASTILADLAANPATARHLARKLAVHFVADDPPPALAARLESAWIRSGGDLAQVATALIEAPEAWSADPQKLKTPYEFLVSSYRTADAVPQDSGREVVNPLDLLGQRPFAAPQPDGWSDQASDWAAPDALVKRLAWARSFSQRLSPPNSPVEVARAVLGARLSAKTEMAVGRAESRPEAFALLLMSPEFQRR